VADFERASRPSSPAAHPQHGYHDRIQVGWTKLGFKKDDYVRLHADAHALWPESPDWFGWHGLVER